jgi:hypothetical protein
MFPLYPELRRAYPKQPRARRTLPSAHIGAHIFIASEAQGLRPVARSFGTFRQSRKSKAVVACPPSEFLRPIACRESRANFDTNLFRIPISKKWPNISFRICRFKTRDLKPFRIRTYEKTRGSPPPLSRSSAVHCPSSSSILRAAP